MKFYFGLLLLLGGYVLAYWGTVNIIRWPGIDTGTQTGTDAPTLAMLIGFKQTADVPHPIPFKYNSTTGTGQASVTPEYQQKMNDLQNQAQQNKGQKPNVSSINPLGTNSGFASGSPIPNGVDIQKGTYNIPGF